MTIGINLLWLVPGVVGGSEESTVRLLQAVRRLDPDDLDLCLYGQPELFDAHPELADWFEVRVSPVARSKGARIALEHTWLPTVTRHDDLVHHGGGVVPAVRSAPPLVTVHDLQPLDLPQHFSAPKRRWLGTMIPYSVRVARLVFCPSAFTADALATGLGVPRSKLVVLPHGQDPVAAEAPDPARVAELRAGYGRFLLLPAIAYPHKRHRDLVAALGLLRHRFPDLSVVLTGRPGPETAALASQASSLGVADRVHDRGRVDEAELDALYRAATALVFPSAYEGFGIPVLEAMARGCPVIAADTTAIPEVVGDAGLLVPVGQPDAVAAAVARVIDEPGLAEQLIRAGHGRVAIYSWDRTGSLLTDCYRQAVRQAG